MTNYTKKNKLKSFFPDWSLYQKIKFVFILNFLKTFLILNKVAKPCQSFYFKKTGFVSKFDGSVCVCVRLVCLPLFRSDFGFGVLTYQAKFSILKAFWHEKTTKQEKVCTRSVCTTRARVLKLSKCVFKCVYLSVFVFSM